MQTNHQTEGIQVQETWWRFDRECGCCRYPRQTITIVLYHCSATSHEEKHLHWVVDSQQEPGEAFKQQEGECGSVGLFDR